MWHNLHIFIYFIDPTKSQTLYLIIKQIYLFNKNLNCPKLFLINYITIKLSNYLFLDLVYARPSHVFLDFRFLFHASVPDRRPSELCEKIFHSYRSIDLRFHPPKGHCFRKSPGRRDIYLRVISRWCSLQYDYHETRRILPEDSLRYRALRK